jgi:general secretion pathway protein A
MYTDFFGLQKLPFNLTPDPAFLYLPTKHRQALAGLTYAILERKGFAVLTGDAGTGKTTLINSVLTRLPAGRVESSFILNPTLTASEFLEIVMLDFDIPDVPASKAQRLWKLQEFLAQVHHQNRYAVLVIDEAHKLSLEVLEEIRLLRERLREVSPNSVPGPNRAGRSPEPPRLAATQAAHRAALVY